MKAMLFIDGSWLYHVRPYLLSLCEDPDFELDYRTLPKIVQDQLGQVADLKIDLVRTYYFGTIAINKLGHDNIRERQFYEMLAKRCNYNTEIYEHDFKNKEVLGRKENCLEVGLATTALSLAFQNSSFDIACILAGDIDYLPLIKQLRAIGKRVVLVDVKGNNGFHPVHHRLMDEINLFDYPSIHLDDHVSKMHYHRTEAIRKCDSCGREEATIFTSDWFYCNNCREEYKLLRSKQIVEGV